MNSAMQRQKKLEEFIKTIKQAIGSEYKVEIIKSATDDEIFGDWMRVKLKVKNVAYIVPKSAKTIKAVNTYLQFLHEKMHRKVIGGVPIERDDIDNAVYDTSSTDGLAIVGAMIFGFKYDMDVRKIKHALDRDSTCTICLDEFDHHREILTPCHQCSARFCTKCIVNLLTNTIISRSPECKIGLKLECPQCRSLFYDANRIETMIEEHRLNRLKQKLAAYDRNSDTFIFNLVIWLFIEFNIYGKFDDNLIDVDLFERSMKSIIFEAQKRKIIIHIP